MREHLSRNRALWERAILAVMLPGIAGAVNACGFFAVGTYTSHVSGNVARIGDELASGHVRLAARSLIFVLSFVAGAMTSTFLILNAKRVRATHMTGIATDIAIESARALDAFWQRRRGIEVAVSADLRKLRLHTAILASFLTGAIVGPMAYLSAGHIALLLPCVLLLALAAFDAWLGLTAHTFAPSLG